MFFEKKGPVWDTLRALQHRLDDAGIDYVVIGGMALTAHKYNRQTIDVDVVLTPAGYETFRSRFENNPYARGEGAPRRFIDLESEVKIDFLVAGELAGDRRKNRSVCFPQPTEAEMHGDLRTVSLARLIELKLVTWRYKDWGDVVELIRENCLPESFADQLDPSIRSAYVQCYDQASDPHYGPM
jgi:hypothetical protein